MAAVGKCLSLHLARRRVCIGYGLVAAVRVFLRETGGRVILETLDGAIRISRRQKVSSRIVRVGRVIVAGIDEAGQPFERIVVLERRRMAEFVSEIFETAAVAPGEALAFAGGRNESFQPKTVIELDGGRIA